MQYKMYILFISEWYVEVLSLIETNG